MTLGHKYILWWDAPGSEYIYAEMTSSGSSDYFGVSSPGALEYLRTINNYYWDDSNWVTMLSNYTHALYSGGVASSVTSQGFVFSNVDV